MVKLAINLLKGKQVFRNTNNMVFKYFYLKTDFLMKETKVVRLWPYVLHYLLRPCIFKISDYSKTTDFVLILILVLVPICASL